MDDADRAQTVEEAERAAALSAHHPKIETPFEIHGRRVCLNCYEPIAARRLKACPQAVRCVDCQTDHERRLARGD